MVRFERIVVATDFSDTGNAAVRAAFDLAGRATRRIDVVHVMERATIPNPLYAHYSPDPPRDPEQQTRARKRIEEELLSLVPSGAAKRAGLEIVTHVREGGPAAEILAVAEASDADLLVLGTQGRGAIERLLLGSVVERVLRLAPCPVLVVGPPAREAAG